VRTGRGPSGGRLASFGGVRARWIEGKEGFVRTECCLKIIWDGNTSYLAVPGLGLLAFGRVLSLPTLELCQRYKSG
jgi:hypothetical protein